MTTTTMASAPRLDVSHEKIESTRLVRCRYLVKHGRGTAGFELVQCTGEVLEVGAPVELCQRHAALALQWLDERINAGRVVPPSR